MTIPVSVPCQTIAALSQNRLTPFKGLESSHTEGERPGPSGMLRTDQFSFRPKEYVVPGKRFAVVGDTGTGDANQYLVSSQMVHQHQNNPFSAVLMLGDNVYQTGEPEKFDSRIRKPYEPMHEAGVPFFPVLGNHDVKAGFGNQQLAYWGVPPFYKVTLGDDKIKADVFALDTTVMLPELFGTFKPALKPAAKQRAIEQRAWLEKALAESQADMKIVMGHYPLYSLGAAAKPIRELAQLNLDEHLAPLLKKYNVDLYMAGHEHHYEKPFKVNGVSYLVSGAGGKLENPSSILLEGNGVRKELHFMQFELTSRGLNYKTIAGDGRVLDQGVISRRKKPFSEVSQWISSKLAQLRHQAPPTATG